MPCRIFIFYNLKDKQIEIECIFSNLCWHFRFASQGLGKYVTNSGSMPMKHFEMIEIDLEDLTPLQRTKNQGLEVRLYYLGQINAFQGNKINDSPLKRPLNKIQNRQFPITQLTY